MMKMIDFTALPRKNKAYAGANGSKIAVLYQGEQYMLKFPPLPNLNKGTRSLATGTAITATGDSSTILPAIP
jgi:hypothetical protein